MQFLFSDCPFKPLLLLQRNTDSPALWARPLSRSCHLSEVSLSLGNPPPPTPTPATLEPQELPSTAAAKEHAAVAPAVLTPPKGLSFKLLPELTNSPKPHLLPPQSPGACPPPAALPPPVFHRKPVVDPATLTPVPSLLPLLCYRGCSLPEAKYPTFDSAYSSLGLPSLQGPPQQEGTRPKPGVSEPS